MGRPKGANSDARNRLAAAAGQGFRRGGFGGVGVDGLAKQAGLTSGAFYAHYGSKADAFRIAVRDGVHDLAAGIRAFHEAGGNWVEKFVDFYLTERFTCDLGESCGLQSLTADVARSDDETRSVYGSELSAAIEALSPGMQSGAHAMALLALLSGGVSMARAVKDSGQANEIIAAVRFAARELTRSCP